MAITIATSSDGITWTSQSVPVSNTSTGYAITYGKDLFVGVGAGGTDTTGRVITSPDGINWTIRQTPNVTTSWIDIAFGNGIFVAIGQGQVEYNIMTSVNGIDWRLQTSPLPFVNLTSIEYSDGLFVATRANGHGVNDIIYSEDGINWSMESSSKATGLFDFNWGRIAYGNSTFIIIPSIANYPERLLSSVDGLTWELHTPLTLRKDLNFITYGNGLFVGFGGVSTTGRIYVSSDGDTWDEYLPSVQNTWTAMTYGNGLFVAVSSSGTNNRVMTSPDGINWTTRTSSANYNWVSIVYGNGLFVAVSNTGTGNRCMTSPDGINWTTQTTPVDNNWQSVTYGNGLFVAVSSTGTDNRCMTSVDGINWVIRTTPNVDTIWGSICYGNGLFVAVGYHNVTEDVSTRVMTSPDGINWTLRTIPADIKLRSIIYENNLFITVGIAGKGNSVITSPDGINWTARTTGLSSGIYTSNLNDLIITDNLCIIVGSNSINSYSSIDNSYGVAVSSIQDIQNGTAKQSKLTFITG